MPNAAPGSLVAFADAPPAPLAPWAPGRLAGLFRRDPPAAVAAITLAVIALAALLAPWLTPYDPTQPLDMAARAQPPSAAHWLGTDLASRDLLSRLLFGARVSLGISVVAVAVATIVGTAWGAVAGYAGGWVDRVLMHVVDAGLAIPRILLLLGIVALWGTLSTTSLVLLLGLTGWFGASRLVRAEVRATRERDFAIAARASGASPSRVLVRHVLPHAMTPMLVAATLGVGQVVIVEAGLAFLGYGVAPPAASWGGLIGDGRDALGTAWWISVFPGIALSATILAINVLGDRLRAALGAHQLHAP
ncbi:MAG TPA: ABC transporter permease [Gemmatimonadaceae bacterium]